MNTITQETMPDGRMIYYSYDANGNTTSITPPGKPTHNFDYTPVDLTKDYLPPDLGIGNVSTAYQYDLDRRPTEIDTPVASNTNIPATTDDNTESTSFTYDGSLMTSITWTGVVNGTVGFTYNNDFKVSSESVVIPAQAGIQVAFNYDNDGLLTSSSFPQYVSGNPGNFVINRDSNNGFVTGTTLGSVSDAFTYNGFGEVSGYNASYGSSTLLSEQYTRDNLGRITQKTEAIQGVTDTYAYNYDLSGRLTDVFKNSAQISHYDYDSNGNRLDFIGASGSTVNGTYDAQDRLITYGSNSYTYTANGELASKTNASGTTQYGYDNFGNLVVVVQPDGTRIEYVVDGQNRRVGKRVNGNLVQGFLYEDELRSVVELDGNGNIVSRFVYGTKSNVPDYMIRNGNTYRIITNHLGSPRLVVDSASGVVMQRMDYDEFGNITQDTNPGFQPFGFAGGLYDRDTGLVRFGARDYDAITGKWTAKDPIRFDGGDTNLMAYVGNQPIGLADPFGLRTYPPPGLFDKYAKCLKELPDCNKELEDCKRDAHNITKCDKGLAPIAAVTELSCYANYAACSIQRTMGAIWCELSANPLWDIAGNPPVIIH